MNILFDNTYAKLPESFFAKHESARVPEPKLIRLNLGLAAKLALDTDWLKSPDGVAMLAGNAIPEGAEPIALAYAGHQFGGFSSRLGDGRALLLGEVIGTDGARYDLQLKGSGAPNSRVGAMANRRSARSSANTLSAKRCPLSGFPPPARWPPLQPGRK
jgi:serine/tyrosine/threonine adenylyltransferase